MNRWETGFEFADAFYREVQGDSSLLQWRAARLDGNRVFLSAESAEQAGDAARVWHCRADAPICNLYGRAGLPVGTFEVLIER